MMITDLIADLTAVLETSGNIEVRYPIGGGHPYVTAAIEDTALSVEDGEPVVVVYS